MRLLSWLRSTRSRLAQVGIGNVPRPKHLPNRTAFARLGVELLEDRTVPSTFTVHNLADSGAGSLRAAVTTANANPGADVIAFDQGCGAPWP